MAKNKTAETNESVTSFLDSIIDDTKRSDSLLLISIMQAQTGYESKLWGPNIIGFGSYHYKYASGHEGDAPLAAFSPRKNAISFYTMLPEEKQEDLLQRLGKHKAGKACVYIKRLSDVDEKVLRVMVDGSVEHLRELYS